MSKRKVEIFSAGCRICDDVVSRIKELACPSCELVVVDLQTDSGATRARERGVHSVPAVAIDGVLAGCCSGRGVDEATLRAAGLGQAG